MTPSQTKTKLPPIRTSKDIVIPAGTVLKEWQGNYEAVIGINADCVVYVKAYSDILEEAPDTFEKV